MDIDFGVQVVRPFKPEGDVRCITTPTGEVAKTVHVGPYDRLADAHDAIHACCLANNRKSMIAGRRRRGSKRAVGRS
jgi:hypothetical protein